MNSYTLNALSVPQVFHSTGFSLSCQAQDDDLS